MEQVKAAMKVFVERLTTNPVYAGAVFGLLYQILAYFGVNLAWGEYKEYVDTISMILIGTGVAVSWRDRGSEKEEKPPDDDTTTKFKTL